MIEYFVLRDVLIQLFALLFASIFMHYTTVDITTISVFIFMSSIIFGYHQLETKGTIQEQTQLGVSLIFVVSFESLKPRFWIPPT